MLKGCLVNPKSADDETIPIMHARTKRISELLLKYGGDIRYRTPSGFSCTLLYALTNNFDALEVLLKHCGSSILFDYLCRLGSEQLQCFVCYFTFIFNGNNNIIIGNGW